MRRAASPPERSMHGVSKALVYQQDAYLLQLRDCVPTISYPDRWSFFGGEIELGESPWQALQRELEEELEWRPHCGRFLYEWINPENPCRIHFFAVPFSGDRSALVLHEGQDLGWFTLDEIADNLRMVAHVALHIGQAEALLSQEPASDLE